MSDEASAPFSDSEVAKDMLFDLLISPRRRFILYYLHDLPVGETTLNDLSAEVGAWEYGKPVEELTRQERKRIYVSLYQTHVPTLAEAGIIAYDSESGDIALTDHINEFGPYLGWEEPPWPWQAIYLGTAIVSLLFYGMVTFNVGPFSLVTEVTAGLLVVAAFLVVTAAQYFVTRRAAARLPAELIVEE
jgi:hypothetical protein